MVPLPLLQASRLTVVIFYRKFDWLFFSSLQCSQPDAYFLKNQSHQCFQTFQTVLSFAGDHFSAHPMQPSSNQDISKKQSWSDYGFPSSSITVWRKHKHNFSDPRLSPITQSCSNQLLSPALLSTPSGCGWHISSLEPQTGAKGESNLLTHLSHSLLWSIPVSVSFSVPFSGGSLSHQLTLTPAMRWDYPTQNLCRGRYRDETS